MKNILIVFGTRPEAIKLSPLILRAKQNKKLNTLVCSTGQHREMLKPVLSFFEIIPDFDLDLMRPSQSLTDITVGVLQGIDSILKKQKIDAVVTQGDTATCFAASLAAFYNKVKVIHVEAGLRSGDITSPFPEEFNRIATALMADIHFAPTEAAKQNLIAENYSKSIIHVTGNTGIDALFEVINKLDSSEPLRSKYKQDFSFLNKDKKLILVTVHRRESFGTPMEEVMYGIAKIAQREDVEIILPLHMNPQVRNSAKKVFGNIASWVNSRQDAKGTNIWLSEPLDYIPFVYLMKQSHLIVTDSGGIQEEAPSLGKPILVARETTERPEGLTAGTSLLVPLERDKIVLHIEELLNDQVAYQKMAKAKNPFGDGTASEQILATISSLKT